MVGAVQREGFQTVVFYYSILAKKIAYLSVDYKKERNCETRRLQDKGSEETGKRTMLDNFSGLITTKCRVSKTRVIQIFILRFLLDQAKASGGKDEVQRYTSHLQQRFDQFSQFSPF